jgi:hypothetical protein
MSVGGIDDVQVRGAPRYSIARRDMNTYNVTNYNVQIHAEASNPAPYEAFIGLNLVARDSQRRRRPWRF